MAGGRSVLGGEWATNCSFPSSTHAPPLHHCGREGHWIRECCTKKKEEAAAANNQSSQTAQASSGSSSRPENKPVGSVNIITAFDLDPEGFYTVVEDNKHSERPDNEGERPCTEETVAVAIAPGDEDH